MAVMPETRLQNSIRKKLMNEFGGYWRKIHGSPYQQRGMPDIIGCCKGLFFGLEVKMPGKKPTPLQRNELNNIADADGVSAVVTSVEEAVNLVQEILDKRNAIC